MAGSISASRVGYDAFPDIEKVTGHLVDAFAELLRCAEAVEPD